MHDTRLSISGMKCAGCVSAAEKALLGVPGVKTAQINFGERTANVRGTATFNDLKAAVNKAGFDTAELVSPADQNIKEAREHRAYRALWLRAIIAGSLGFSLYISMLAGILPDLVEGRFFWVGISLATLFILIFVGGHYFTGAWVALKNKRGNMDSLISVGTGAAWLYSSAIVLFPNTIPSIARHVYFESAIIILALVSLGSALEARARGRTSLAIKRLTSLQAKSARIIREGKEEDIPIGAIGLDEILRVRPGEIIPVDGVLIEGHSFVDESMLTGEPVPVNKKTDSQIFGGCLNTQGSFTMKATKIGQDTALSRIIELVRKAQSSKPEIGQLVDKIAAWFVPSVIVIAALGFTVWSIFGPDPSFAYAVVVSMTILVIACPCALGLATPISIMVSVGRAADNGILIRNGEVLQQASKINTVVLDKTGTLTEGRPKLTTMRSAEIIEQRDALAIAASLEAGSEHPLAIAIVNAANDRNIEIAKVENFTSITGQGVSGQVTGESYLLGNKKLMQAQNLDLLSFRKEASKISKRGQTPIYLANSQMLLAIFAVSDPIRAEAKNVLDKLRNDGLKTILLTGDSHQTAHCIAAELGIDDVYAELMPEDKVEIIASLQAKNQIVAMVGDGINDAPALAQADVGIAIGTGTDVALEASDIALMGASINGVSTIIALSKATLRNIKQNLAGAFFYNVIGIPIAAGVLFPFMGILLSPMVAATAMSLSSVTVVSNALRLMNAKLD